MKAMVFVLAAVLLGGCASGGRSSRGPDAFIGGEAGDLRVLFDDGCPQVLQPVRSEEKGLFDEAEGLGALSVQLLSGLAGTAFQSFGAFLKHAGQEDITRSAGSNGGLFYSPSGAPESVTVEPRMRCVYVVRNGFSPTHAAFASESAADLQETWQRLGLTRTPDLYAALYLETVGEAGGIPVDALSSTGGAAPASGFEGRGRWNPAISPPFFRLRLERLYVRSFQNPQASGNVRDLALIFNYGLATTQTAVQAGQSAGVTDLGAKFAVGGVRLTGVRPGDYDAQSLTALQTAWMPAPGVRPHDPRATVDLVVYGIETAPGNPLLAEIGEYLSGTDVRRAVESAVTNQVRPAE
jgi:hypothetical protein